MSPVNRTRIAGAGIGLIFGLILCWSGMASPDVIRGALLFEQSYLYLFFASAVATASIGLALVKRRERRAILVDTPIAFVPETTKRRHITGSLIFGLGWGVSNACPGPIATQISGGSGWAVFTFIGVIGGIWLYLHREATETEPATDRAASAAVPSQTASPAPA
jgi:uncharacterized membrane protein YedE/YeeE